MTRVNPKLGMPREGVDSGWIEDRVVSFEAEMAACGQKDLEFPALR